MTIEHRSSEFIVLAQNHECSAFRVARLLQHNQIMIQAEAILSDFVIIIKMF